MKVLSIATGAGLCFFASACASAEVTTITQYVSAYFAEHGSSGEATILQYSGPLKLNGVRIDWHGYASTFYSTYDYGQGESFFQQPYDAFLGFSVYDPSFTEVAFRGFGVSGETSCSNLGCSLSADHIGVAFADPESFVGSGDLLFIPWSNINPTWYSDDEERQAGFYEGTDATVTYYLGTPEPSSWAMMLSGFGLIGGAMRYRRKTRVSFA